MHIQCRTIETNNAQFTYETKMISFAIKKMIKFESYRVQKMNMGTHIIV